MSIEPRPDDDRDDGIPLFWGTLLVTAVAVLAVWLFGRPVDVGDAEAGEPTVVEALAADGRLTVFSGMIDDLGLAGRLGGSGPYTVFAPTDDVFATLTLPSDPAAQEAFVLSHVAQGRLDATSLGEVSSITMLSGDVATVGHKAPRLVVGGATVAEPDVGASNGVVHVLSAPVSTIPVDATAETSTVMDVLERDGRFAVMIGLVQHLGLDATLHGGGPFTVFAPTDQALMDAQLVDDDGVLQELILDHVVEGTYTVDDLMGRQSVETLGAALLPIETAADGSVLVGGAPIVSSDLPASNGIVHAVGHVVVPQATLQVDAGRLLESDGRFGTILGAFDLAGLALGDDVTVIAPTDSALSGLPEGVFEQLLADRIRLGELLRRHVIRGTVAGPGSYTTLGGDTIVVGEDDVDGVGIVDGLGSRVIALDGLLTPDGFVLADINDIIDLAPITFEVGSAVITAEGRAELDRAAVYLTTNPVPVEIGGHTDSDGDDAANQQLSVDRAVAVVDYLVAGGVDPGLLTAVGYGESRPVASNDTDEGKALNRRIEFSITG